MRQVDPAANADGGVDHVLDGRHGDALDEQRPTDGNKRRARRRLFPLSLRASLVLVIFVPIAATIGFASATGANRWSSRDEALTVRRATLDIDSLMRARAAIVDEEVPSAAFVAAAAYHISPTEIDSLLGIDFKGELVTARRLVDRQTVLRTGSLETDYRELLSLRRSEAAGTASNAQVQGFFTKFGADVDTRWLSTFDALSDQGDHSAPLTIRNDMAALRSAYTVFTSGFQQTGLVQDVLATRSTTAQVEGLIVATEQFELAVQSFHGQLGPRGAAAWQAISRSPQAKLFNASVQLAIQVGLRHEAPPYASDLKAHAAVFTAAVQRTAALTGLVLAAVADLIAASAAQQRSATDGLVTDLLAMSLLLVIAVGGAVALSRATGRPLARIVNAADAVRAGEFDLPPLEESGPRELALAAGAFNEMSSTLRAVEAHAVALAENELDNPALRSPLPGRTGRALQVTLDQLKKSMRANEEQRDLLHEHAMRDSLTGLLNRRAAVEALDRDLARSRRGGQALALLFIDLDGLKVINDTFGHEGGDAAIRAVADVLRATTRQEDVVARIGGDEFIVACLGASDGARTSRLAERIRQQVARSVTVVGGQRIEVACSIGVAVSEQSDVSVDSLMHRADQALYLAKAEGRGSVPSITSPPARSCAVPRRPDARRSLTKT